MKTVSSVLSFGASRPTKSGNPPPLFINACWCVMAGLAFLCAAFRAMSADCVPPPAGLVCWWRMENNGSDDTLLNPGVVIGNPGFVPGEVGLAMNSPGARAGVIVSNGASLNFGPGADFSIEAWVRPVVASTTSGIMDIVDKRLTPDLSHALGYALDLTDGRLSFQMCDSLSGTFLSGGPTGPDLRDGAWHHVAATIRRGETDGGKLYIDGVPTLTFDPTGYAGSLESSAPLLIGLHPSYPAVDCDFRGGIDEVSVYARALSSAEVQAIYNAGSGGKCGSPTPPFIFAEPANQTVTAGDDATFTVIAGGNAPLSYQWSWNGTNIDGATGAVLTLTNVQLFQAGGYRVSVSNALGTVVSSNAVLTVNPLVPPAIVTQPASQTVNVGASVSFTVGASGSAPLSYQWRFNGTNINGATTSKLTLNSVQVTNSGNYSALVTNLGGSAISSNGVLSVIPVASLRLVGTNAPASSSVTVPVQIVAGGNEYALGFSISFSTASLTYAGVSLGSGASSASLVANTNLIGSGKVGLELVMPWNTTLAPGTQELARLTFTIPVVTNTTSATISFGDQPIVRQISDVQAITWPATYSSAIVLVAAASALEGDVSPRPGGNRSTALTDWVLLGRYVARLDYPTNASEFQRADCAPRATRGDGRIAVTDWVQTRRYADGLEPLTPAGGPTDEMAGTGPGPSLTRQVRVMDTAMAQGGTGTISVSLAAQGNENALGFGLAFDPALVSFVGAALGNDVAGATLILNTSQVGTGQLGVVLALPTGGTLAAGTREILSVTVQAAPAATGSSSAAITDQPVLREISDAAANALPASYFGGTITLHPVLPTLNIAVSGGNVVLYWPAWAAEFNLQTTGDTPLAFGNWTNVASAVQTNGGNILVPLPISDGAGFFRLWHQ